MLPPRDLGRALNRKEGQRATLSSLLQLASTGVDVSPAAPDVIRYVVNASRPHPALLPLALDVLAASPSHAMWAQVVDAVAPMIDPAHGSTATTHPATMRSVVMAKLPTFPDHAVRRLLPAVRVRELDGSYQLHPVAAALAVLLRDVPITQRANTDEQKDNLKAVLHRIAAELIDAILHAQTSPVPALILSRFVCYIDGACRGPTGPASSPRRALAAAIAVQLVANRSKISARVANNSPKNDPQSKDKIIHALAIFSGHLLREKSLVQRAVPVDLLPEAKDWAISWISTMLDKTHTSPLQVSKIAIDISEDVDMALYEDQANRWATAAISKVLKILEGNIPATGVQRADLVVAAARSMLRIAQRSGCGTEFLSSSASRLLPFVFGLLSANARLQAFLTICRAIIQRDMGNEGVDAATLCITVFLGSKAVDSAFKNGETNSSVVSEFVACCTFVAVDSAQVVVHEPDLARRKDLSDRWGEVLSKIVLRFATCLSWPSSPPLLLALEGYLKVFEALGQLTTDTGPERSNSMESYEKAQEILVRMSLDAKSSFVRSALLLINTRYWIESGLKAEANAGHILKATWIHLQGTFNDSKQAVELAQKGQPWHISSSKLALMNTLELDSALVGSTAAMELTRRIPRASEKVSPLLLQYLNTLDASGSFNAVTQMTVEAAYYGSLVYADEHHPTSNAKSSAWPASETDRVVWLLNVRDACVMAGSRSGRAQDDEAEAQLEQRILKSSNVKKVALEESDSQTLSGSSDPLIISANHSVDREKGIVHLTIFLQNKCAFPVADIYLEWQFGCSLHPLPGAARGQAIGDLEPTNSRTAHATALVQPEKSGIGKAMAVVRFNTGKGKPHTQAFHALPYTVPSSDILLLGPPAAAAGLNVFRRRWDYLSCEHRFFISLSRGQTVDLLVDILERRSPLKVAGRMNAHTQVVAMMSDSSISKHATLLMHIPDTVSREGHGPATAFVSIRSAVEAHSVSLGDEIRLWLRLGGFQSEIARGHPKEDKPSTSRFVRVSPGAGSLQRWRKAQRARLSF